MTDPKRLERWSTTRLICAASIPAATRGGHSGMVPEREADDGPGRRRRRSRRPGAGSGVRFGRAGPQDHPRSASTPTARPAPSASSGPTATPRPTTPSRSAGCARAPTAAARPACPAGSTPTRRSPPSRRGSWTSPSWARYAIQATWGDGHATGYHTFELLREHVPVRRVRAEPASSGAADRPRTTHGGDR